MSKRLKVLLSILLLLPVGILLYLFIFNPRLILGNDVGPYKNGKTVITMSKYIYTSFKPINLGTVVIFRRPDMEIEGIAVVKGLPGGKAGENAYYFSNEPVEATIPPSSYLIRFGESQYLRLIHEDDISAVVWYPFY